MNRVQPVENNANHVTISLPGNVSPTSYHQIEEYWILRGWTPNRNIYDFSTLKVFNKVVNCGKLW